jgi:vacuolar-type H+-ATPase subunit I/STV1
MRKIVKMAINGKIKKVSTKKKCPPKSLKMGDFSLFLGFFSLFLGFLRNFENKWPFL